MSAPPRSQDENKAMFEMEKRINQLLLALIGMTVTGIVVIVSASIYLGGVIGQVYQNKDDIEKYRDAYSHVNELINSIHDLKDEQHRTNDIMLENVKQTAVNASYIQQYIKEKQRR